ncbi:MAG: hypothetical protein QME92_12265 [Bacillota bacterium]|nr:hypothetical protein [Bacillota bacterium]
MAKTYGAIPRWVLLVEVARMWGGGCGVPNPGGGGVRQVPKGVKAAAVCIGVVCLLALGAILMRPAPPEPPGAPGAGQAPGSSSGSGSATSPGPGFLGGPGIAATQGRFVGRSGGERRWEFDAEEVRLREGESRVVLEGIHDGILYDGGEVWLRFSAARGEADTATNDLKLGNVRFLSRDGDVLTADRLSWSEEDEKVVIEGNVRVEQDTSSVLVCDRAEYHPGDNVLEAIGRTTVEIEVPGD